MHGCAASWQRLRQSRRSWRRLVARPKPRCQSLILGSVHLLSAVCPVFVLCPSPSVTWPVVPPGGSGWFCTIALRDGSIVCHALLRLVEPRRSLQWCRASCRTPQCSRRFSLCSRTASGRHPATTAGCTQGAEQEAELETMRAKLQQAQQQVARRSLHVEQVERTARQRQVALEDAEAAKCAWRSPFLQCHDCWRQSLQPEQLPAASALAISLIWAAACCSIQRDRRSAGWFLGHLHLPAAGS